MDPSEEPRLRPTLRDILEELRFHLRVRPHSRRVALPHVQRLVDHRHQMAVEEGWEGTGAARLGLPDTRRRRVLISVVGMEQPDKWRLDPPPGWTDLQIWPGGSVDLSHDPTRANALTRRFWDIRDVAWDMGGDWTTSNGGEGGRRGCRVRIRTEAEDVFLTRLRRVRSPDGLNIGFNVTVVRRTPAAPGPPPPFGV